MLIIGHRGAAGLKPENTIEGLRAGFDAGADMLEFDIRVTSDHVPILMHDTSLLRTNGLRNAIRTSTLAELQALTEATDKPIATLESVMEEFFGKIMLNIEIKQHGASAPVIKLFKKYCKTHDDWQKFVISSFHTRELKKFRKSCAHANIWMLHGRNPFLFVAYARSLKLSGVGFDRMYLNDFALAIAHKTNLLTYVYTVNRVGAAKNLADKGIDGLVTNFPDRFTSASQ